MPAWKMLAVAAAVALALMGAGLLAPAWLLFLATMAASHGLAVLGIVVLMRGGGASFGQGMFFAIGAYVAAMAPQSLGITDGVLRAMLGTLAAGAVGAVFAPLLSRYRGIFYAMLTLALSMVMYGLLSKASVVGGTDGLTVAKPTLLAQALTPEHVDYALYALTVGIAVLAGHRGVAAVFVASLLLEIVRSFSNLYFPNTWQLALGVFLLVVILFRPEGIGSLWAGRRRAAPAAKPAVPSAEVAQ